MDIFPEHTEKTQIKRGLYDFQAFVFIAFFPIIIINKTENRYITPIGFLVCWLTNTGGMAISIGFYLFKICFIFTLTAILSSVFSGLRVIQPLYVFCRFPFVSFVFKHLACMIKGFLRNRFSRGIAGA